MIFSFSLCAIISFISSRKESVREEVIDFTGFLIALFCLLLVWYNIISQNWLLEYQSGTIMSPEVFNFHLVLNPLSLPFLALIFTLSLVIIAFLPAEKKNYTFCFSIVGGLATGIFTSQNPLTFYFFWTLILIFSYLWLVDFSDPDNNYFPNKFFLMTIAGNLLFLFCLIALSLTDASWTGGVPTVDSLLKISNQLQYPNLIFWGMFLSFALSLPLVPFHTWFVDLFKTNNLYLPALFSVLLPGYVFYGLIRFWLPLFPAQLLRWRYILSLIISGALIYTGLLAWRQKKPKDIMSRGMLSLLYLPFLITVTGEQFNVLTGVFNFMIYGLSCPALLLLLEVTTTKTELSSENYLTFTDRIPLFKIIFLLFVLVILGFPPFAGFPGRLHIFSGLYSYHRLIFFCGGLGLFILALFLFKLFGLYSFNSNKRKFSIKVNYPLTGIVILLALLIFLVFRGFYPGGFFQQLKPEIYTPLETLREVRLNAG
ncbi:MAG: proton-conducting transporter membrane subunit [bacterium]